jgi:hypothetical protein
MARQGNRSAIDGVAIGRHVIDAQGDEIAATQLAVDGEIKPKFPLKTTGSWRATFGRHRLFARDGRSCTGWKVVMYTTR